MNFKNVNIFLALSNGPSSTPFLPWNNLEWSTIIIGDLSAEIVPTGIFSFLPKIIYSSFFISNFVFYYAIISLTGLFFSKFVLFIFKLYSVKKLS